MMTKLGKTYSWTFWCWNPNSGDTEGLFDALKPAMAPMIGK